MGTRNPSEHPVLCAPVQALGQLSACWTRLPALDHLDLSASANTKDIKYDLSMTSLFLTETRITSMAIDTEIPGYKPEWKIDFNGPYTRALNAKHTESDQLATSSVTERVNTP